MATILDVRGQPIKVADLEKDQTSVITGFQRRFDEHPSNGLSPAKLKGLFDEAEQGNLRAMQALYKDMEEKDGHIMAEMSKRAACVGSLSWDIDPPAGATPAEVDRALQLKEIISGIQDFEDVILGQMTGVGHGYACLEMVWGQSLGLWAPTRIELKPADWFTTDKIWFSELRLDDNSYEGLQLKPFQWIVHKHRAKHGALARAGLVRVLAWPYLFKNFATRDLAEFLQVYGLPIRLGKFPPSATNEEKHRLLNAVVALGRNAAGIIPQGMEILFEAPADGKSENHMAMIDWCERTESKVILGQTLTAQADRGSNTNALGNIHNEVRMDIRDNDAKQVASTLTRDLVYPINALNFKDADPTRRFSFRLHTKQAADLKMLSESLPALVKIGVQIPVSYAAEQLQIPVPKDGEPVLAEVSPAPGPTPGPAPAPAPAPGNPAPKKPAAKLSAALPDAVATADAGSAGPVGQLVDRLALAAEPGIDEILSAIGTLVEQATSLQALRSMLIEAFDGLPTEKLQAVLALANQAAALHGVADVQDGD